MWTTYAYRDSQPISEISNYANRLALSVDLSSHIFNNHAIKIQESNLNYMALDIFK